MRAKVSDNTNKIGFGLQIGRVMDYGGGIGEGEEDFSDRRERRERDS